VITEAWLQQAAARCKIDLIGVTDASPLAEHGAYIDWVERGNAAGMAYLTDHRGRKRADVREILPGAQSVIAAAVLYNSNATQPGQISRYATVRDYHEVLRERLERLVRELPEGYDYRICVDTVPVLERALAHRAGLGWIGKNTCLINQRAGSWFFLGEVLTSLAIPPARQAADERCGSCTRCIDACPTRAIVPHEGRWEVDSRLCISYHTIEAREPAPPPLREHFDQHIFGCDICQDVCPWNRRAPGTIDPDFAPLPARDLVELAQLTAEEFRATYRQTPVYRARHRGFLRNIAVAMGTRPREAFRTALEHLADHEDAEVQEPAMWALARLNSPQTREPHGE
jgi:epoxyqueuosine reductase